MAKSILYVHIWSFKYSFYLAALLSVWNLLRFESVKDVSSHVNEVTFWKASEGLGSLLPRKPT